MGWYQHIMAAFYDPFMQSLEGDLLHHRQFLLNSAQGKILEVGAGTGVNFTLYPKHAEVYAIEPSKPMFKRAMKKIPPGSNIRIYNTSIEEVENIQEIPAAFDTIVSMLVLCTVKNLDTTIEIYKRLLRPGGLLLVLEHIHASNSLYGKFQTLINPIWRPFADGCNLTRRQDISLKTAGFIPANETYFRLGTDWYRAIMQLNEKKSHRLKSG